MSCPAHCASRWTSAPWCSARGDVLVVPKGVRHNPVADEECLVMLIERKSTRHTGDVVTDKTRPIDEQLRPV